MIMKKLVLFIAFSAIVASASSQNLKSPAEFLGYELGTQFSWHSDVNSYFKYVADHSESVIYESYGKSYEGRELGIAFISTPENLQNLEQFRKSNLIKIGMLEGDEGGDQIPFVWLAYNIHGNEAAGMEAALKTLYVLASKSYPGVEEWLKESVIVVDPCQNPDGRDRNTSRYRMTSSNNPNVNMDDWTHHEAWPGSRPNHYLFDLNRDWAWQTQIETVQRIKLYNRFMPHVHADFHEMGFEKFGFEKSFYFVPGAKPFHESITPWQLEFHKLLGSETARLFDEKSRLYFTKEKYDLLYPGYGDSWPLYNGSIGLTFEQSRYTSTGINVKLDTKDTLTLMERIDGHFMATMATINTSVMNRKRLLNEFNEYFTSGLKDPQFEYKSVIIKGNNDNSAIRGLLSILDGNQIRYSQVVLDGRKHTGFDYLNNTDGEFGLENGDILISAYQPQSHLVKVLFEPKTTLTDSLTFGLTAWALPYVFNIEAYASKEKLSGSEETVIDAFELNLVPETSPYAFIADWQGFNEVRFMSELYKKNINIRYVLKTFYSGGKEYNRGSLIITKADNSHLGNKFDQLVIDAANKARITLVPLSSGLSERGFDIGSPQNTVLKKKPEIALIGGKGTETGSFGQLWYFFQTEIDYPVTVVGMDYLTTVDLTKYDLIILPSGEYKNVKEKLFAYVKSGGQMLALEKAISMFTADTSTSLNKSVNLRKKEIDAEKAKITSSDTLNLKRFEDRQRESLSKISAGGIYKVTIDDSHPYAFGLSKTWFILKGSSAYPFLSSGNNIAYILDSVPVSGFVGHKLQKKLKNTIVVASEKIGKGEIVYVADDPYHMAFWKSGRILLGNIIFR
jgi:hypothetical protein